VVRQTRNGNFEEWLSQISYKLSELIEKPCSDRGMGIFKAQRRLMLKIYKIVEDKERDGKSLIKIKTS
jgi:hypothetical protein